MYHFLKNLFLICLVVILVGCTTKTSKNFSYTMADGSLVTISIEYKPRSVIRENDKFGSYYYIVRLLRQYPPNFFAISFYDRKGHSLFTNRYGTNRFFLDNTSYEYDELNRIDGGWEWIGRFYEENMTFENFRDIHSIKVTYR